MQPSTFDPIDIRHLQCWQPRHLPKKSKQHKRDVENATFLNMKSGFDLIPHFLPNLDTKVCTGKTLTGENFPIHRFFTQPANTCGEGGRAPVVAVSCYKATSPPLPPQLVLNTSVVHTIQHEVPGENLDLSALSIHLILLQAAFLISLL